MAIGFVLRPAVWNGSFSSLYTTDEFKSFTGGTASLKWVFDADTADLTAFYDDNGGSDGFVEWFTRNLGGWGMAPTDLFSLSIEFRSRNALLDWDANVWADDFALSSDGAPTVPIPAPVILFGSALSALF